MFDLRILRAQNEPGEESFRPHDNVTVSRLKRYLDRCVAGQATLGIRTGRSVTMRLSWR